MYLTNWPEGVYLQNIIIYWRPYISQTLAISLWSSSLASTLELKVWML